MDGSAVKSNVLDVLATAARAERYKSETYSRLHSGVLSETRREGDAAIVVLDGLHALTTSHVGIRLIRQHRSQEIGVSADVRDIVGSANDVVL